MQLALPGGRAFIANGLRQYVAERSKVSITVVQTGMGVQKARIACEKILAKSSCHLVISSGFAGALIPASIGNLVIPEVVVSGAHTLSEHMELSSFPCSVEYLQTIRGITKDRNPRRMSGLLVTVTWIVCSAAEKNVLAQQSQASAVDMESAGIAEVAKEYKIPFLVVRTVSDLAHENLPKAFNLFLSPSTWIQGIWRMVSEPTSWAQVYRLRRQTIVASQELTNFYDMFFTYLRQQ